MRTYRNGTIAARNAARGAAQTKACKRLMEEVEQERRAAEIWAKRVEANEHILTTDGEPVEE